MDKTLQNRLQEIIEVVEATDSLHDVRNVKKMSGGGPYYRIRMGDYRIGISIQGNVVTFVRFVHRKDIYRYFP